MANRFWVGGNATWDGTAGTKWALTSGGAGGQAVPTASDDVFLDAASGANTVTITADVNCKSFDCTGFTGTFTVSGSPTIFCNGNFKLVAGMTFNRGSGGVQWQGFGAGWTITTAGKSLFNVTVGGNSTTVYTLQDNLTANGMSMLQGKWDWNGKTVSGAGFTAPTGGAGRILTTGAATVTLSSSSTPWNTLVTQGSLTINAAGSTITCTGTSPTFAGGGAAFGSVVFSGAGTPTVTGANTFANLTRTGTAVKTDALTLAANQIVSGTFTATGNSTTNRVLVQSDALGTPRTITAAVVAITSADFMDIAGAGAASPFTGTSVGDCQGTSGITFTGAVTRFAVVAGNWSSTATWSTTSGGAGGASVPLPQDAVVLNASSAAGTYTTDMPRLGGTVTCTGFTRTWTTNVATSMYGDLTLGSGGTYTTSSGISLCGRGAQTITTAGSTAAGYTVLSPGGTYTLQDNFNCGGNSLFVTAGTFDANNRNLTIGSSVTSPGAFTRQINMGIGTWTLSGTGTVWNIVAGGLTLNAGASTIVLSDTSATGKTFVRGSKVYNNLSITTGGAGTVTFTGDGTHAKLSATGGSTKTVIFTAGTTTTLTGSTDAFFSGAAGNLITITSTAAGSAFTISKASGIVSSDYLSLKDSTATGGAAFYAGANSTNVSGNTGWIFRSIQVVSPAGIATSQALGSPTVTSLYTISPSGIASAGAVGSPTVTSRYTISPSGIASVGAVGAPMVTSLYTISPSGIASAGAVGSPTVTSRYTISPSGIASAGAVGSPIVTSRYTISPLGIASAGAVGSPTVTSRYTISPLGISSAGAVGSPTVTSRYTISPLGIASAEEFGLATVVNAGIVWPVISGGRPTTGDVTGSVSAVVVGNQEDPEGSLHGRVVRMRNGRTSSTSTGTRTK